MLENGAIIKHMDLECMSGAMETDIKGILRIV